MISPFEVYLVLQMDRIGDVVFAAALSLSFLVVLAAMPIIVERVEAAYKWLKGGAIVAVLLCVTSALLPSTKTMAAMLILPAITSDEVVEPVAAEAKELYDLAKEALRQQVQSPTIPEKKDVPED